MGIVNPRQLGLTHPHFTEEMVNQWRVGGNNYHLTVFVLDGNLDRLGIASNQVNGHFCLRDFQYFSEVYCSACWPSTFSI